MPKLLNHKLIGHILSIISALLLPIHSGYGAASELPTLGDASSAVISSDQEHKLGRAWLRQLRAQAPTIHDPLIFSYLHNLVYLLASNSDLEAPDLEIVVINSPAINAFAVPGGVMGFNAGLLLNAQTEDELAGVIAHELAHLSQRHFARRMEYAQRNAWTGMAALLASILVAATAGGEAGMAALATTQAASIDSQLRFSRSNEQEADRIGMQTLVQAGMNPDAMADFFEQLQRQMRYNGNIPPEFLLTHPVTESRITDARQRAARFPRQGNTDSLEFELMKIRTTVEFSKDSSSRVSQLEEQKKNSKTFLEVNEYGLACAYAHTNQLDKALESMDVLLKKRPNRITYLTTKAEILNQAGRYKEAQKLLDSGLTYSPDNYALSVHQADALTRQGKTEEAVSVLREQITRHPDWPLPWYMLAEAYGKSKNRLGVYQAKAEYYFLYGQYMRAIEQLQFALPLAKEQFQTREKINQRILEIHKAQDDLKL